MKVILTPPNFCRDEGMCENTSFGPWLTVAVKKNVGFPSLPKVSVIITCRVPTLAVMGPNVRLAFSRKDAVLLSN